MDINNVLPTPGFVDYAMVEMRAKMKMRKSEKGICECVKINDFLPITFPGFVDYAMIEANNDNENGKKCTFMNV